MGNEFLNINHTSEPTPAEKAEIQENIKLAQEVTRERRQDQLDLHGKTDQQLQNEADALLKSA